MKYKGRNIIVYHNDTYIATFDNDWFYTYAYSGPLYFKGYLVHCNNGPAIEWNSKDKEWYLNGKHYTEKEYWKIINLKKKSRVLNEI